MKRIIIVSQIIILSLFVIKLLFLAIDLQDTSFLSALQLNYPGQAIAETSEKKPDAKVRDINDDSLQEERNLMALLQKKQKDLDAREHAIKAEEEKVQALKKEIMDKIDVLKALDSQISAKLDADRTNDAKRLKDLAKVYEATPPQKAAAMMEKLETKTAAGITINMKRERAGLIWGYLNPQKAVEITKEITRTTKPSPE